MQNSVSNLKDFQVISKLGEGAFGQVFRVKRKADEKQYALKKVKIGAMKQKQRQNALNQIRILASYNQQFIIGYKQAFYDEPSATLCVVMEFASGGDILKRNQTHLKNRTKYKQQQIWRAMVHMTLGLKTLHDRKILHRDLKCANVFITGDNIYKLGDLNVSKVLKKDMALTQTGTPYYASPQVWKDKPYDAKSDMWSLGCVLYEMAALRPPFTATDLQGLYKKVIAGIYERIPPIYSQDLATVIGSLLKVDPSKRANTQQILSNPIVHKYYKGQLKNEPEQQNSMDQLLQTIKYNPRDLKGLKNFLPKANYQEDIQQQKLKLQDLKGGIQSCKNSRKQAPNIKQQMKKFQQSQKKLSQFLQKKRQMQEKQRLNRLKILMEQKQQNNKKRQRVMSAGGLRPPPNLYQSPKIAIHSRNEMVKVENTPRIQSNKALMKKQQIKPQNMAPKLPPKPQQGLNYKLPPKPSLPQPTKQIKQQVVRPPTVVSNRPNRSNSVQKIIYPSWWG